MCQLFHVRLEIGLEPLVHPAEGEAGVGVLHVQAHPADPRRVHRLVKGPARVLRHLGADFGKAESSRLPGRVVLGSASAAGLLRQVLRVGGEALQAEDHGLQEVFSCRLRRRSLRHLPPYFLDDSPSFRVLRSFGKSAMVWERATVFQRKYTAKRSSMRWHRGLPYSFRTHSRKLRCVQKGKTSWCRICSVSSEMS